MPNTILNTTDVVIVTNKSGTDLSYGDVVILSSVADKSVTTTTDTAYVGMVGAIIDPAGIANDSRGAVSFKGYVPRINLTGVASRLDDLIPSATPGSAVSSPGASNSMGVALTSSATPEAYLYGPFQASTSEYSVVGGRLTLTTATPITTSDVTGATTLYYTPDIHGRIGLYFGGWSVYTTDEISVSLAAISSATNYDVFAYYTGSAVALELLAWTNATTRATAIARQDGVWVKSGDATQRYLGTIRASGAGTCEDSVSKRFVWNAYNRHGRNLVVMTGDTTWSMSPGGPRPINGNTGYRIESVIGLIEDSIRIISTLTGLISSGTASFSSGIGVNSTSVDGATVNNGAYLGSGYAVTTRSELISLPTLGYSYYQWLETVAGVSTVTGYGDTSQPNLFKNGIIGLVMA